MACVKFNPFFTKAGPNKTGPKAGKSFWREKDDFVSLFVFDENMFRDEEE
jgi:hypothetical protein